MTTHIENVIPQKTNLKIEGAFSNPVEPFVNHLNLGDVAKLGGIKTPPIRNTHIH